MNLYGRVPYVVVYILACYGHNFVEPINPDSDGAHMLIKPRNRMDPYNPQPNDAYNYKTSDPGGYLISLNIKDKRQTDRILYHRDEVKKTDTFIARDPFIFYKIQRNSETLWTAEDEQYFPRVVVKETPDGKFFFRVYYTTEPTESEIEHEHRSEIDSRTIHRSVPTRFPKSSPESVSRQGAIPVITVDIGYKQNNKFITYECEQDKNREIFTTNTPFLIKKVVDAGDILWESKNGMYAHRIIYRPDPVNPKLKVFFPEEQEPLIKPLTKTESEAESEMDIRIVTRSDLESQSEGKSEPEFQRAPRPGGRLQRHPLPQSGSESEVEHQYRADPRLKPQPRARPRLHPGDRQASRDIDYPSSAEPIFERTPRPQRKQAPEPSQVPRDPYEHFSEPELQPEVVRQRRPKPIPTVRPTPRPAPAAGDEPVSQGEEQPVHRDRPEDVYRDMPEPEFRPIPPSYVEPRVPAGKKIPISLDIEFKFCTYLFDYHRVNNLGTYTPKEDFVFAKIRRNDKFYCMGTDVLIWQTHDPKLHSTKVHVIADNRVVIHLNNGKTLFYMRGFDSLWYRVDKSTYNPIDWNHLLLDLDLGSRRSTQYYEYFCYHNYMGRRKGTYLYVARERFRFKMVYLNRKTVWRALTEEECAYKVGVYRAIGGTEQVTVFLVNGDTRTYIRQLYAFGMGSNWYEDIITPGYGGQQAYGRPPPVERTGVPPAPTSRTGVQLNLPGFTDQIKDKLSKLYEYVDISKLYNRNPFSAFSQNKVPETAQMHASQPGNVKQPIPVPTRASGRSRTFDYDDDDEEGYRSQAEFVNFK